MIIYGKNYDELRAFRFRQRIMVETRDTVVLSLNRIKSEFNYRLRSVLPFIGDVPEEFLTFHISEIDKKTKIQDVTIAFAPFDSDSIIRVVLLDDKELKAHVIPKNMKRLEVAQFKGQIFGSARTQAESLRHTNKYYEPWGFDLSTGNFVWKEVK